MSQAVITLIILAVAIILFISDKLPMGLVAFMVPVALYFTGIIEANDIFSCVINSNVILILGMCVIGAAFFKTGMAYKTSQFLLRYTKSERGLILVVTLLSGIMSGFVSNSGTVAVLLPIVMGITASSNIRPIKLLMPLVIGATIGADVTIIGSPGNLIAKNTIEEFSNGSMTVNFFEYAKIGIPMLIVVAIFLFFFGSKLINDREAGDETLENPDYSDIPKWHGVLTIVVLIATIIGMVLTDYVEFLPPMHVTACCGAIVLVLFGVLSQKEAFASFEMLTVFMLAFMMPLGTALNDTGAGEMIANAVVSVTGQSSPFIIMASLWILTWALTQVMSNTAACTPMAIPANSMIIGPGNVRFKDFIKPGLAVSVVCFIVSMILLPIFYPFY